MAKLVIEISLIVVLLIVFSIQGTTEIEQTNQIQPNQQQLKNVELSNSLNLNPDFGKIPLYFIPNEGQVNERALFYAETSKYTLWLTKEGLVFDSLRKIEKGNHIPKNVNPGDEIAPGKVTFERNVSRLVFKNANRAPELISENDTDHKVNYLIGNDELLWRTNIETSQEVVYKELYPNIDLKVYGIERQIEYDFIVKPGGKVSDICFEYRDIGGTKIDGEGNLVISTGFGELGHSIPVCYQVIEGKRTEIAANFKRIESTAYGFNIEEYNRDYDLIIDPVVLVYSTYLGGSGTDSGTTGIAVDAEGAVYVTGATMSRNFPKKNPIQKKNGGNSDIFISKINSSGNALVYSTYLGGSGGDFESGIAVDAEGAVYLTGATESSDFPTRNPIQRTYGGNRDSFVAKIDSAGSKLVYSTYLGGADQEEFSNITVDSEGAAYVTGGTKSTDFPTRNPIQKKNAGGTDIFISKVSPEGNKLEYSTYLGGSGTDYGGSGIAVDAEGAVYVIGPTESSDFPIQNPIQAKNAGGSDLFITKINSAGSALIYSSYLGGSGAETGCLVVDAEGAVYMTGYTNSTDFPTRKPIQKSNGGYWDAFITKVNSAGSALIYSSYLGGSDWDSAQSVAVDSSGEVYVIGETRSSDFPTRNPIQGSFMGGFSDAFITKINASGSALIYSTYLGGSGEDSGDVVSTDSGGAAYIAGYTDSVNFPTWNPIQGTNAGGRDVFIAKIETSDRIRVVSWNILDYPDMNQEPREEYFRSILKQLDPDILVVQEMASAAGVSQFLKEVLNPKKPKLYKAASFFDGPDTDNALFYKKAMFKLVSRQQIPTSFRDITEYEIKIKKGEAKGTKFKIHSLHFSEGAGAKKKRENEALTLRTYLDGLAPDELFLVCGSFNMRSSTEKAFKILTDNEVNNNGRLMDPIHKTGKWHDKSKLRRIHTESTRKSKFGGGVGGGLDDRYDMILISYGLAENEELIYADGSYSAFGNDGKHLNKAIDKPKNKAVSPEIAEALYQASDHLPVIIDLLPVEKE